jgi:DNA-directed RNA polymerase subunit L
MHKEYKMPRVTLYIRNEDMTLWNNLDNKAEAVSTMLRGQARTISSYKPSPVVEPYKAPQPMSTRKVFDVLKDIQSIKDEYKDKLEYCQDTDTRASLEQELQDTLDSLWLEYNSLKANI